MGDLTDNPDLEAIAGDETVVVRKAALATLFDLAVNSLDFGSGFWETADAIVAREVAEVLGVCPMLATPRADRSRYPLCEGLRQGMAERADAIAAGKQPTPYWVVTEEDANRDLAYHATHKDHS